MIITAGEIVETLPIAKEFPPQFFNLFTIQKQEDLLSNQFLGEAFYEDFNSTRILTGTFDNVFYQAFYDRCFRTLLSESIMLSVCLELTMRFDNVGLVQLSANDATPLSLEMISVYKTSLSEAVNDSKLICNSYLTNSTNKANFPLYLQNAASSQVSESTKKKSFAGFLINFENHNN
jgi:hypothetical protein